MYWNKLWIFFCMSWEENLHCLKNAQSLINSAQLWFLAQIRRERKRDFQNWLFGVWQVQWSAVVIDCWSLTGMQTHFWNRSCKTHDLLVMMFCRLHLVVPGPVWTKYHRNERKITFSKINKSMGCDIVVWDGFLKKVITINTWNQASWKLVILITLLAINLNWKCSGIVRFCSFKSDNCVLYSTLNEFGDELLIWCHFCCGWL